MLSFIIDLYVDVIWMPTSSGDLINDEGKLLLADGTTRTRCTAMGDVHRVHARARIGFVAVSPDAIVVEFALSGWIAHILDHDDEIRCLSECCIQRDARCLC